MRLLVLYQHAPTPGAPGIYRHRALLGELAQRGWEIDLISSPVNYMDGRTPVPYAGTWYTREEIDGVTHHWVRTTDDIHRSMRRRALSYLTYAARARILGARLPKPDLVWASSPPLSVATVGNAIARSRRRPWLLEVRDLWPETATAGNFLREDSALYRFLLGQSRRFSSKADAVIVTTPGLVDLVKEHGARDVTTITGALVDRPPQPERRAAARAKLGVSEDECLFVYLGSHGIIYGLGELLDAAADLEQRGVGGIRFVLAGDGSDRHNLEARLKSKPIASLQLLGPVPKDDVVDLLAAADVGLHLLRPDPLFASALPTKVMEYLGAHLPFVTNVAGLPQEIALASGGSYAADTAALASELQRWAEMPSSERQRRGDEAFNFGEREYGLHATVDRLEDLLRNTIDTWEHRAKRR